MLIAEDDPDDLFLIRRTLHRLRPGLSIAAARDGIELFEYLGCCNDAELPGLIIIDLNMPRMDGREVLRALRQDPRLCSLPVVVMTTSVEPEDFQRAKSLNAMAVISKPEQFTTMVSILRTLLDAELGAVLPGVS